jgi:hypothetical protein
VGRFREKEKKIPSRYRMSHGKKMYYINIYIAIYALADGLSVSVLAASSIKFETAK